MRPVDGFWIVQYEGVRGSGGGVITFLGGRLYGGDSGYTYIGTYEVEADHMHATVHIRNFLPGVPNDLGIEGDFDLSISGTVTENVIHATASPIGNNIAGLAVRLTRVASF